MSSILTWSYTEGFTESQGTYTLLLGQRITIGLSPSIPMLQNDTASPFHCPMTLSHLPHLPSTTLTSKHLPSRNLYLTLAISRSSLIPTCSPPVNHAPAPSTSQQASAPAAHAKAKHKEARARTRIPRSGPSRRAPDCLRGLDAEVRGAPAKAPGPDVLLGVC